MNRKKTRFAWICILALSASIFAGCSSGGSSNSTAEVVPPVSSSQPQSSVPNNQDAKAMVRIGTLQGPAGIGMVELMEKSENRESNNLYDFTLAGAPDELTGKLISGELDIAAVPTNAAALLNQRTEGGVKIISVSTLGVLYLMQAPNEDGEYLEIESVADLEGQTIYSTGQGATQEYVLNYLLNESGVTDAEVIYKSEHAELATLMSEGTARLALLPQPFVTTVTMRDDTVRTELDITEEWEKATGGTTLPMGAVVVRSDFLEKNQGAVDKFLEEYKESTAFANSNVEEAAALSGKFEVIKEEVAKLAIPHCNIVSITGEEMKTAVSAYLDVLYAADAKSIGEALPDESFYYIP